MVRNKATRNELMLMKRFGEEFMPEIDEVEGSALAMDVDDYFEPLELFSETFHPQDSKMLVDRNFFNSFEDDFDDADIN